MYALLVTSMVHGTRNILLFDKSINEKLRKITIDDTDFKIVRRVTGQIYEVPGVNLYFHDETEQEVRNPSEYSLQVVIHLCLTVSPNLIADDKTLKKLQRLVDIAMLEGGVQLVDYTAAPVALGTVARWFTNEGPQHRWQDLTDLKSERYVHAAKSFEVFYRGDVLS